MAQTTIPDCGSDTACLALYERASQESKQGNLAEAVRLYKLAYEVRADPKLLFSIARLLHRLDRRQEAILYYKLFIESPLDNAEQKRKAEQYLEQARQGTGAVSPALPAPRPTASQQPISSDASAAPPTPAPVPSPPFTAPPQPLPSQTHEAPTTTVPVLSPAPPVPPLPLPSQNGETSKVARESARTKRPRWRLVAGGTAIGAGLILTGFGGSALAARGKCVDIPTEPAQTCDEVFATTPIGGALLGTGAAVVIGGILLMAWP